MRRWFLVVLVASSLACGSEMLVGDAGTDGTAPDGAKPDGSVGDGGGTESGTDAGVDSGPLTCPLTSYVPDQTDDECRPLEDQACNPAWPCTDAGTFAFHYKCSPNFSGPPFGYKNGQLPCGKLTAGEFCCLTHRCMRDKSLDNTCSKQAGHDYNWACPKGLIPPKYDSGVTAICAPNSMQPDSKLDMLCCDDLGP